MSASTGFERAGTILEEAIAHRTFPCAVAEAGDGDRLHWQGAFGALTFDERAPAATLDTCFDLASLTKPLATTTVLLSLVEAGQIALEEPVARWCAEWRGADRDAATIRDLLEHASGLPARLPDHPPAGRREFEHDICAIALEHPPRTKALYSDLGFILLGFLAADRGGASLDRQFEGRIDALRSRAGLVPAALGFRPSIDGNRFAPTWPLDEDIRRGRLLAGEVHDNYAAALGGVAGHAGLFGTAGGVGAFARAILSAARGVVVEGAPLSPALVRLATRPSKVAGSSRALGWDTMLVTSSCGHHMSPEAFGHVGFTGTSLWIDPGRNRYFVLLTNRACGGGTVDEMRDVRRAFHDALCR
jgi:CubicO group peptidase (beta-lactamase class C family)